jgi:hypothetical protein
MSAGKELVVQQPKGLLSRGREGAVTRLFWGNPLREAASAWFW